MLEANFSFYSFLWLYFRRIKVLNVTASSFVLRFLICPASRSSKGKNGKKKRIILSLPSSSPLSLHVYFTLSEWSPSSEHKIPLQEVSCPIGFSSSSPSSFSGPREKIKICLHSSGHAGVFTKYFNHFTRPGAIRSNTWDTWLALGEGEGRRGEGSEEKRGRG